MDVKTQAICDSLMQQAGSLMTQLANAAGDLAEARAQITALETKVKELQPEQPKE